MIKSHIWTINACLVLLVIKKEAQIRIPFFTGIEHCIMTILEETFIYIYLGPHILKITLINERCIQFSFCEYEMVSDDMSFISFYTLSSATDWTLLKVLTFSEWDYPYGYTCLRTATTPLGFEA